MSNNELVITSEIAYKATLVARVIRVVYGKKFDTRAAHPAVLVSIQDRVNGEPSCHYLNMEQAEFLATWLMARVAEAKLTGKV